MRNRSLAGVVAAGFAAVVALILITPRPAEGFIPEINAAECRAGGEDVEPPGQSSPDSKAFVKALMATGFIVSIDDSDPTQTVITFDPTVPNSKFKSAGVDLTIPDGAGPGVALVLSPLVIPDETFPAHAHCRNLKP
jgi:hypothetical protein